MNKKNIVVLFALSALLTSCSSNIREELLDFLDPMTIDRAILNTNKAYMEYRFVSKDNTTNEVTNYSISYYYFDKTSEDNYYVHRANFYKGSYMNPETRIIQEVVTFNNSNLEYDVALVLDCSSVNRISNIDIFNKANITINIDHHDTNTSFATYNLVDRGGPACCLTLSRLFKSWNIEIDKSIGSALTTGIITDTVGFRYNNISDTYDFVSSMIKLGVDVTKLYYKILTVNTMPQFELKKIAQSRLAFYCDNKVAFTYILEEDDLKLGTKTGDHEGIIEIGKDIEGVEVSIFARFQDGKYRVSLRSNNDVDVSSIAAIFDGGGHKQASGFVTDLSLETLRDKLILEVSKRL